jgi:hypothetical protein
MWPRRCRMRRRTTPWRTPSSTLATVQPRAAWAREKEVSAPDFAYKPFEAGHMLGIHFRWCSRPYARIAWSFRETVRARRSLPILRDPECTPGSGGVPEIMEAPTETGSTSLIAEAAGTHEAVVNPNRRARLGRIIVACLRRRAHASNWLLAAPSVAGAPTAFPRYPIYGTVPLAVNGRTEVFRKHPGGATNRRSENVV